MNLAALALWMVCAAPPDAGFVDATRLVGEARVMGRAGGFASSGSLLTLNVDPAAVIPGDRMLLYEPAEEGAGLFRPVGAVTVVPDGADGVNGVVSAAARELSGRMLLGFSLPLEIQLTRHLPFFDSIARAYLASPPRAPLAVALMDVTNPRGERTIAGDRLQDGVERALCARPQFVCVPRERVETFMREERAATARALDGTALLNLRARLAADVVITGHYHFMETGGVEYALRAVALSPGLAPPSLWRRGVFTAQEWGGEADERITVGFQPLRRARITIKALDAATVEGVMARRVAMAKLEEIYPGREQGGQRFAPAALSLTVGDREVELPGPGATYSALIPAGPAAITIEYLPRPLDMRMEAGPSPRPLSEKVNVSVEEGEELIMTLVPREERGYAILAVNYSKAKDKGSAR